LAKQTHGPARRIRCYFPYTQGILTQRDILAIPSRRPIKPVYIRRLVRFVDQVRNARNATA
jgi:hypothetical protein